MRRNVLDDINKRDNPNKKAFQKGNAERKSTLTEGQVEAINKGEDVPTTKGTAYAPKTEAPLDIKPEDLKVETPQVNTANPTASAQPSAATPVDLNAAKESVAQMKTPSKVSQKVRDKYPDLNDSSQYLAWLRKEEERDRNLEKAQLKRDMWGSIGEGLGAISDLYFSTKGAPLPQNKANVSDKMRERYTRMKAEADKNRHEKMNNYLRILQQKRTDDYNQKRLDLRNRELEERQERYAAANKVKEIRAIAAALKDEATARRLNAWANDIENMSDAKKANMEADTRLKDARAAAEGVKAHAAATNANANQVRANKYTGGSDVVYVTTEYERDDDGNVTKQTQQKQKGAPQQNRPSSNQGNGKKGNQPTYLQ